MLSDGQAIATLAVSDMDRARRFYEETLGFTPMMESPEGVGYQAAKGTGVFIYPSEFAGTNKATAVSFNVDDFDAEVAALRAKGVAFMDFDYGDFKTENGVAQTPDGPAAWFADPDGNIISLVHVPMEM